MSHKLVVVWFVGGLLMLGGSLITGNLEMDIGVSSVSYYMALIAALILFLLGGLCWIAVAAAAKGHWKL
ncbi:MAG: hypothetical protein JSV63_00235 [Candidatus Aenigmatarchaeota archaeon]|nr:MAG: hypothetical protein JSV63_00235 [Candidatus Aenigmarchaeota archaeon]